ncbi:MAG: short-chain dehydrogenase [Flavobacteriales bacterium]|nr:short-chain dehydrogenase [Flavobacteriales bacterium]|tara:strand:+ start:9385 stop:10116 length:732 start_codon:yes stop_codon:yes gene_type:complete
MLKGKIIIVTGGEGLLGREMVKNIRSKGGIAISADITNETDLAACNVKLDITDEKDISAVFTAIEKHFGKIDGLVNNAYPRTNDWGSSLENTSAESWQKNVDWQMNSVFVCIKHIVPYLNKTKGSVVNIGSIYGVVGNDFTIYENTGIGTAAAYSAIKGGLINFTRYLASYYGPKGMRFNMVSPGGIFDNQNSTFVSQYEHKVPMKRMGNPDDIAPAVSFLLSEDSKYITGHNLIVDGGWTAI